MSDSFTHEYGSPGYYEFDGKEVKRVDTAPASNADAVFHRAAEQSVQRTAFLAGLGVGIFTMAIVAIVVSLLFGCR